MSERDALIDAQLDAVDEALSSGSVTATEDLERELQELALALRAESPDPDSGFAAELGGRVRDGFPRKPRLAWLPRLGLPQLAGLGVAASILAAAVVVAALVPASEDDVDLGGGGSAAVEQPAPETLEDSPDKRLRQVAPAESGDAPAQSPAATSDEGFAPGRRERAIERSASLTLAAPGDRLDRVAEGVTTVTERYGGFVLRSSLGTGDEGTAGGSYELRIPEARLQPALRDLAKLGEVRSRTQSGEDVTSQVVSASDRLEAARAQRRGLLRRLESADTDTAVEALRAQLDVNAREISGLRASLRGLRLRTAYAAVSVELQAIGDEDSAFGGDSRGDGLSGALDDSLSTLSGSLELLVRALGALIPLGLLAALGWLGVRALLRRRREGALV